MRFAWFSLGLLIIVALGISLFLPGRSARPTTNTAPRFRFVNDTDLTQPAVSAAAAIAIPEKYQNTSVCLTGYYQHALNLSVLADHADLASWSAQPPLIWVDLVVPTRGLECQTIAGNEQSCFGQLTLCGVFSYSSSAGFGPDGKYQYQLGIVHASSNRNTNTP